ncbi:MAG: HNH endonuclease [Acidaminococcaceae bacterium]
MKLYVGIIDFDLFQTLKEAKCSEVNFWRPAGNTNFKALSRGEMFLFKLHSPYNLIVGGGFFQTFKFLPTSLAWEAFGIANGAHSCDAMLDRIYKYRKTGSGTEPDPEIGCVVLSSVFYFDEGDEIPVPADWSSKIVQGKLYSRTEPVGAALYEQAQMRLNKQECRYYQDTLLAPEIGFGHFKLLVMEAYKGRCAISGEQAAPVLRVAQIRPSRFGGLKDVSNGLLLRSDYCTLFERGYITVTPEYQVAVSERLLADFGEKSKYKELQGRSIILPENKEHWPSNSFLEWHNKRIFLM